MNALTLRQPWAWAVFETELPGFPKNIENRDRRAKCGRIYIHAGKTYDYEGAAWIRKTFGVEVPGPEDLLMGFILGSVEIVHGAATSHPSKWFMGPYGYVLLNPIEIAPFPYRGMPGFFNVGKQT